MKSLGFRRSLMITIILWTIVSIGSSSFISYLNQRDSLIEEVTRSTLAFVRDQSELIETFIKQKSIGLHNLAEMYKENKYVDGHAQRLIQAAKISNIGNLTIGFNDGVAYQSAESFDWINHKSPKSYDPRKRPWWNQILNKSGVVFTDVYLDNRTNKPMISFGQTVDNGILLGDIDLSLLNEVVKSIDIPGSISIIIDDDSKVLATSTDRLENGNKLTDYEHLKELATSVMSKRQSSQDYINSTGLEKTMFSHQINIGNKKWFLMVGLDKSVTYASLDSARNDAIVTTIVFVVFGTLFSIIVLRSLYTPILKLKETVIGFSQGNGDLTQRLDIKTDDDLGQIATGINIFVENLQKMMLEIKGASCHLNSNILTLQDQANHNITILRDHVSETEQVVTAVEEMNSTADSVAGNAAETARCTQAASSTSESLMGTFNQAQGDVEALVNDVNIVADNVQKMSAETQNIHSILNVIGEITEQTNLLALNAAIEAARAGEHGRGFAVVADEVRNLASRTKASTSEIEKVLDGLLRGNLSMVEAMDSTKVRSKEVIDSTKNVKSFLESMKDDISEINDLSTQIATAAEEQSGVTQEISRNIVTISELVKGLDVAGSLTAEKTDNIAAVNTQLAAIVNKFKLD